MISAKTRTPAARARLARVAPGAAPGGTAVGIGAHRAFGRADADAGEQAVDVGGDEHGLDQPPDDPRDDQADEEDQAGADQLRQEGEDLGHQLVDRREDLAEAEELQRGHDADQPDDQLGDGAELVADGLVGRAGDMCLRSAGMRSIAFWSTHLTARATIQVATRIRIAMRILVPSS